MHKKENRYYPSEEIKKNANVNSEETYKEAEKDPVSFWEKQAEGIVWREKWSTPFAHNPPYFSWFSGGKLNITESFLDPRKDDEKTAIIFLPELEEEEPRKISYAELYKEVNRFANALREMGIKKGDPVGIYMPMIPEAVIAMIACARIGAMHTVVFSAFSSSALRIRLQDTSAKVLITADGYYRGGQVYNLKDNADEGVKETSVEKVVVVKRAGNEVTLTEKDAWWHDLVEDQPTELEAEVMNAEDPMFILYTSGSTGKPKGVLHSCGGYAVQTKTTGKFIFDFKEDDIFWSTADIGWITGHTYTVYAPLLSGATTVMFEGLPNWPNPDRWADVIEEHGVTGFYTAPTAIRMFKMQLKEVKQELKTLRVLGSVGEPIDELSWEWYFREIGKERCPIMDTWWQTETGGVLITSLPGVGPFKPTFTGRPLPGLKFDILDSEGNSVPPETEGDLVILPPFSPGMLMGLYNNEEKYINTYFSDFGEEIYYTSDTAYKDEDGLIRIVGRADDVIKVAGHRLTTGELENAISKNKSVAECAVAGVKDEIRGEVPVAFLVLKEEREKEELHQEIAESLRKEIGPIALIKEIYIVSDIPKTRSGKMMRRIIKKLFTGEDLGDLSTLSNPESVEVLRKAINE